MRVRTADRILPTEGVIGNCFASKKREGDKAEETLLMGLRRPIKPSYCVIYYRQIMIV